MIWLSDYYETHPQLSNICAIVENFGSITGFGNINTENVTDLGSLFRTCNQLTSIDVGSFDTADVTNMTLMFSACNNLTSIDLSSFNTSKVTNMTRMFASCSNLQTLTLGENWDMITGNPSVVDTFYNCNKLAYIIDPACIASQYATEGTQIKKLIDAITGSGFTGTRQVTPIIITCADNEMVRGTYVTSTGWSWSLI